MKVTSLEKFNTSRGLVFVLNSDTPVKKGDNIEIDGNDYKIKEVTLPSKPQSIDYINVIVE